MRNIIITRSFIFLNRKIKRLLLLLVTIFLCARMMGETIIPDSISNPIRTGFHPDPSICRVGEDYYLVTSSFTWFPGLPIYHSRDLTNWSLIGHALTNPKAIFLSTSICVKPVIRLSVFFILSIFSLFFHFTGCVVVSQCGFNLHAPHN